MGRSPPPIAALTLLHVKLLLTDSFTAPCGPLTVKDTLDF
ncbi:hypothetical protein EB155_02430 [archaeon]|nr:hypothetical protein [archaeon]NDB78698.1 hypothetical protein [archaeon]